MVKIAVLVSGYGSNLQAIIDAVNKGDLRVVISLVISDNAQAYALKRAVAAGIRTKVIDPACYSGRPEFEKNIISALSEAGAGFIVLAGFMRILSREFVSAYPNRILNIHPSLLPAFKGSSAIKEAFDYGVKISGVTVHFVDEKMDHGPIIIQKEVVLEKGESFESFKERIHAAEHVIYPRAISLCVSGKLKIEGRKVEEV